MSNENEPIIFDRAQLLDNIDNDIDVLKTLCQGFLDTLEPMVDDVRSAVKTKDPAKLASTAHKLKGSFANYYAGRACDAALALEKMGKEARFEDVDTAFSALEHEVRALTQVLEGELGEAVEQPTTQSPESPPAAAPEEDKKKTVSNFTRMLKDLNNDRKLFRELGTSFLATAGQQQDSITAAGQAKNSAALLDAANGLKGMVSGYYAERLTDAIEALTDLGRREKYDTINDALQRLGAELKLFCDELQVEVSFETTEAGDALVKKKADVLDIIEELRISIETTDALKNAIQHRIDDLESSIREKDGAFAKLSEEFESLRDEIRSGTLSQSNQFQENPSGPMLALTRELTEKISTLEKELTGENEALALTRKDVQGIVGMLKDFKKMFTGLIIRFAAHISSYHPDRPPPPAKKPEGDYRVKKYTKQF